VKTTRIFAIASVAFCLAWVAGCSTPDSRIRSSPDAFARLNPDQQALVKAGQIAPGFDMEAVKLALGDPDRVVILTNAKGQHQVWHYITYEDYDGGIIYMGYYHRYWGWGGAYGWPYMYGGMPYIGGYPVRVHDRFRVAFGVNGLVESIQEEKP
jgi:hypothetical protein